MILAAVIIAQVVALLIGYFARPPIDRWLAGRRWTDHAKRCTRCHAVFESSGPRWLYCMRGRELGEHVTGERWSSLADVLRESDGVPREVRHVH